MVNALLCLISSFTTASVFWKWTLSSPVPCTIRSLPSRPLANVIGADCSYPAAFSSGSPM